jgi:hypothetical protein
MLSDEPASLLVAVRARARSPQARKESVGTEMVSCVAVLALIAGPLPYLLRFDHGHYFTALLVTMTLAACSFYSPRGAIAATMVFLAALGDYRRYAGYFEGYPVNDPLLLVAPAVAVLLLAQALLRGRRAPATALSKLVLALVTLMLIEMFNPAQGGLQIGFAGALFYLAPLLWFWVGRSFASLELAHRFTRVILGVGIAAMLLGLYQTYFGLLSFEQQWVEQIGYQALHISDEVVRAIGFFSSSAEYQRYLVAAAVTAFAVWLSERSRLIVVLPLFLATIFLSAARGPVIMVILAIAITWAIRAGSGAAWLPRLAVASVIGATALIVVLGLLQTSTLGGRVAPLVARQVGGLLEPGNEEKSTATGHLQMFTSGILTGIFTPAGQGLGATTEAAHKYGARNLNSEIDLANIMISVGILGGVLYLAIAAGVIAKTMKWWRIERRPAALAVVGILFGTLGGWLIGGEYSVAALLWFLIGLVDRLSRDDELVRERSRARAPGPDHA